MPQYVNYAKGTRREAAERAGSLHIVIMRRTTGVVGEGRESWIPRLCAAMRNTHRVHVIGIGGRAWAYYIKQ
jgi:hypothetical protein